MASEKESMATIDTPVAALDLEPTSPEIKRYHRQKMLVDLVGLGLVLIFLAAMAAVGGLALDGVVRRIVGDNYWLRLIALGLVYAMALELIRLPLDYYSDFVLEHRYELSNQTFRGWVVKHLKGYAIGAPLGLLMLVGVYALLRYTGAWWWVWATAGTLLLMVVMGMILPVLIVPLFFKVTRLDDVSLFDRLRRIADGTGLTIEGVYRLGLSAETRKANAMLAGLGRTRRVLLGDTLLDQFTPEEIEVVFAHEVGHHVHRHLPKLVLWSAVTWALGFWLIDLALHRSAAALGYASFDDPAALPLLMLVPMLLGLLIAPLQNALSRFFERQCDRYALERTHNPTAYRAAFVKLAQQNKADPDPHPLHVWLFDDHPPIRQRLAMAELPGPGAPVLTGK
jgi:STE24 endopeptidase